MGKKKDEATDVPVTPEEDEAARELMERRFAGIDPGLRDYVNYVVERALAELARRGQIQAAPDPKAWMP